MLEGKVIAVVLPAYKAEQTLDRTIAEISRQVVDGRFDVARRLLERRGRVRHAGVVPELGRGRGPEGGVRRRGRGSRSASRPR